MTYRYTYVFPTEVCVKKLPGSGYNMLKARRILLQSVIKYVSQRKRASGRFGEPIGKPSNGRRLHGRKVF